MPTAPRRPCTQPGCRALVEGGGKCPAHRRAADRQRGTARERGYGTEWQRLRALVLKRDPICRTPGCGAASTDVDHIVARRAGGADHPANLQGLCHACHSRKTATHDRGFGR